MPGPGPHMMYAMCTGVGLTTISDGRFSPHHVLTYSLNAFFGPDIGSFSEWVTSNLGFYQSDLPDLIHHPLYYVLILGIPLSFLYSWLSRFLLQKRILDSPSGLALSRWQCFLLISAGSFSHFFLDHLFEENGHSEMYTWILSTGWWQGRAPVNPDAVIVVGFLCICLILGYIFINRYSLVHTRHHIVRIRHCLPCWVSLPPVHHYTKLKGCLSQNSRIESFSFSFFCQRRAKSPKSSRDQSTLSCKLIMAIASLYCLWCAIQIYGVVPRRPAVGEEADLGVLLFLVIYFFLPHSLCIKSMHPKDAAEGLPLAL